AAAAPAAPENKENTLTPVEKLRQALDKPITIKLEGTLAAAVQKLASDTKITIVLDGTSITQQLNMAPEQAPLAGPLELKEVKIRSVLRTLLQPFALDYVAIGDTVIVTTEQMAMIRQLHQHITVDMDKVEFAAALKQIAHDTATNLILDPRAEKQSQAKVSLQLEDVELETAVRLLAEMAGLKPVRVGNTLFITTKENAADLRQDADIGQPQAAAQEQQLLQQQVQQQLQFQLQLGAQAGGAPGAGAAAVPPPILPPNVAPAVPPASDTPKDDKPAPADKPKDSPPADPKPPTK
ncbi:MAG TPA: hypothetical protein VMS17_32050, partial [Gemmataceae bacterium]|nr:hypothetical protein [Gemmataceae bacterium]